MAHSIDPTITKQTTDIKNIIRRMDSVKDSEDSLGCWAKKSIWYNSPCSLRVSVWGII